MDRKDFDLTARAIKRQWQKTVDAFGKGEESIQVHYTAARLASAYDAHYSTFDRERFLVKCGIEAINE